MERVTTLSRHLTCQCNSIHQPGVGSITLQATYSQRPKYSCNMQVDERFLQIRIEELTCGVGYARTYWFRYVEGTMLQTWKVGPSVLVAQALWFLRHNSNRNWKKQIHESNDPSLVKAILVTFRSKLIITGLVAFVEVRRSRIHPSKLLVPITTTLFLTGVIAAGNRPDDRVPCSVFWKQGCRTNLASVCVDRWNYIWIPHLSADASHIILPNLPNGLAIESRVVWNDVQKGR